MLPGMPVLLEDRDDVVATSTFKTDSDGDERVTIPFGEMGKVDRVDDDGDGDAFITFKDSGSGWLFRNRW